MFPESQSGRPVSEKTAAWLTRALKQEIAEIAVLKGATSSAVYRIRYAHGEQAVLRQFTNRDWLQNEPDLAAHEAAALRHIATIKTETDTHYPHCLAADEDGSETGLPSVLMSLVEGDVNLHPTDLNAWIKQQAIFLANFHNACNTDFGWHYRPWYKVEVMSQLSFGWSSKPANWQRMVDRLAQPEPTYVPVFLHRDYHPTNVLWKNGTISGVIDWVNACVGPAMIDVGHCRLNLASLFGFDAADLFLQTYLNHRAHDEIYDPFWDMACFSFEDNKSARSLRRLGRLRQNRPHPDPDSYPPRSVYNAHSGEIGDNF